jgi:hypothetical protein
VAQGVQTETRKEEIKLKRNYKARIKGRKQGKYVKCELEETRKRRTKKRVGI